MQKLEALKTYLIDKAELADEVISAQVKSMVLKPKGRDESNQVLLHTLSYQASLSLIGFPYQVSDIAHFNAHVMTWLADQGDKDDLTDAYPSITIDLQDPQTANLEVSLTFEEEVYITPSAEGGIEYSNTTWSLGMAETDVALSAEVNASLAE